MDKKVRMNVWNQAVSPFPKQKPKESHWEKNRRRCVRCMMTFMPSETDDRNLLWCPNCDKGLVPNIPKELDIECPSCKITKPIKMYRYWYRGEEAAAVHCLRCRSTKK